MRALHARYFKLKIENGKLKVVDIHIYYLKSAIFNFQLSTLNFFACKKEPCGSF